MKIRLFPDPVLRDKAVKVSAFGSQELCRLIQTLDKTMRSQPHGIGIAAPQIGVPWQVARVDVSARIPGSQPLTLINPQILKLSEETVSREGCMSLPDYRADIKRYNRATLIWQDFEGKSHEKTFEGLEAICIQHECDHLQGRLFLDHVVNLKRDMIPRKPARSV